MLSRLRNLPPSNLVFSLPRPIALLFSPANLSLLRPFCLVPSVAGVLPDRQREGGSVILDSFDASICLFLLLISTNSLSTILTYFSPSLLDFIRFLGFSQTPIKTLSLPSSLQRNKKNVRTDHVSKTRKRKPPFFRTAPSTSSRLSSAILRVPLRKHSQHEPSTPIDDPDLFSRPRPPRVSIDHRFPRSSPPSLAAGTYQVYSLRPLRPRALNN